MLWICRITNPQQAQPGVGLIHYTRNFPVDLEVANLLSTSYCNGIWETTRHNRHNGLLPAPTCYGLAIRGNWCNGIWP